MFSKYLVLKRAKLIDPNDILLEISCKNDILEIIRKKQEIFLLQEALFQKSASIIQEVVKKYLIKILILDTPSQYKKNTKFYINKETFLGKPIDSINTKHFFTIKDNGRNYAFDIRELKKIIEYNPINPYNNQPLSTDIIKKIKRILYRLEKK